MKGWKEATIGEISCYLNRGFSPKYVESDGDIVINQKCIRNGRIDVSLSRLTDKNKIITREKILQKEDILINSTGIGTAGRVAINRIEEKATADSHVSIVRIDKNKADPFFVFYNLRPREADIESFAEGSTGQIELGRERIKLIDILLPPLPEQKAIAAVLSSLDDKIDLLHRQNKTLEAMAETLFRQWFVEEADEGWEEVPLSFFAENIRENVKVENLSDHEHYVGLEHIPRKRVILDSWGTTDAIESNKSTFKKYDILFGKLRSYFHKVVCTPIGGVCSTDILVIRPKEEHWLPFCLFWFFSKDVVEHSDLGSGGTRMPRTNWEIVSSYKVPCPPEELIIEFDRIIRPSLNKMFQNINAIRTLEKIRDTLLPKLMSGEIRVKV